MLRLFALLLFSFCLSGFMIIQDGPSGLGIGEQAPEISAMDQFGNEYSLSKALNNGKVVVIFYRGSWCKYCNKHLSKLQDSIQLITDKGASVIAITPEKPEFIKETSEKYNDAFKIIYDQDLSIMNDYEVRFTVDKGTVRKYKFGGINLDKHNGETGAQLPVPATYIVNQDRKISYVYFNQNYKERVSIREILDHL